jgi:prepilin-type N-terminal cleavage/methylation domain-containing protein
VTRARAESGFTLIELMVATGLLLVVSAIVTNALLQMSRSQRTISNRTEMHSGIRGATELLQQEVGQAGRVSFPATISLTSAVAAAASCDPLAPATNAVTVQVVGKVNGTAVTSPFSLTNGINPLRAIFASPAAYELVTTMDDVQETVKIASVDPTASTITACFTSAHAVGTVLQPLGGFATGIVPPSGVVNGSTPSVLKMYGDGNMVYVEYSCDFTTHNLYRNVMDYDAGSKPAVTNSQILLSNIVANPGNVPCFTYQTTTMLAQGTLFTFVLDVAVTLTVQTQQIDPITNDYQKETKALLNVSPRNVFNAWTLASLGYTHRIQSTPASVANLLAN